MAFDGILNDSWHSSPLFNYDLLKSLNSNSKLQPLQQNVESIENVENVESAMHIISACPNLAKNQYQKDMMK